MATPKDIVESAVAENKTVVFAKSYCPYCKKSKALLESLNVQYALFDLDLRPDGDALQAYLLEKTGQKSVPNIFVSQQHVGKSS
ncbi:thioltransferase, partial [Blyttiomyces helicus]